ncbi:MAG: hypothetical protein EOO05_12855 [Chitinophagaceae bacterium]|nr:MAG: hypothetical protein EOO05_12855 [Chitinophagaceae bacterium]
MRRSAITFLPGALTIAPSSSGGNTTALASGDIHVNSAHHQVIDKTADSFRISCYSPDGQPEALERKSNEGKGFLLCVQWHPERMFRFNLQDAPASAGIRDRFLKETKKYSKAHENL